MKNVLFFIAIALLFAFVACNNAGSNNTDHTGHDAAMHDDTETMPSMSSTETQVIKASFTDEDPQVAAHIDQVLDHYFSVKDALVASNTTDAKTSAEALINDIKGFDKSLLTMKHKEVYDNYISNIQKAAADIAATDQLEPQRAHFETLSNNIYELTKAFGGSETVYNEYCPMAFDNKGAMWLSESKEIRNPYFGDAMLTCGKVQEIIE